MKASFSASKVGITSFFVAHSGFTRSLALIWLMVIIGSIGVLAQKTLGGKPLPIETNILALLPKNQQDPIAQQAFDKIASAMSNKVVFLLEGTEKKQLIDAAQQFEQSITTLGLFSDITGEISESDQQAWANFYYPKRFQLLTDTQKARLSNSTGLQTQYVLQSIYNPFSGVTGQELANDPFLLFRDYLTSLSTLSGDFQLDQGYLSKSAEDKHYILIAAELNGSPYNLAIQDKLSKLVTVEQTLTQQYAVNVMHTGVIFYATYGTESAKSEISTIGLGSLVGVIALLLLVYRSPLPLTLSLLSISCGFIAAFTGCLIIFGKIHLFSLVFGTSLIGVSIDYSFHYLTERLVAGKAWDSYLALRQIFGAITLGLITSLVGYLGLLVAPFPGLQQLALFSTIGLTAAYISVVVWYPILARQPSKPRILPAENLSLKWLSLWRSTPFRVVFPSLLLIIGCYFLSQTHYNDDVRQLQATPIELKLIEQKIEQLSGVDSSQQMLLVSAIDGQALLDNLHALSLELDSWVSLGFISGYQNITQYLPSIEQQKLNFGLVEKLYQSQASALQKAVQLKQTPVLEDTFMPITVSDYLRSDSSQPTRFLWLGDIAGKSYSIVLLKNITKVATIKDWTEGNSDIRYLDKTDEISTLFGEYREKVTELLIAALVVIWFILGWRFSIKQASKMVAPPIIASICALAITSLNGTELNLFNLLALALILGIGIDYTLFFAQPRQHRSTLIAITLSAMTTILSFGLLAMSNTHAIHSFGITVLIGIFVAWLLAPIAMNLNIEGKQ